MLATNPMLRNLMQLHYYDPVIIRYSELDAIRTGKEEASL
jgi:hypothetical protein